MISHLPMAYPPISHILYHIPHQSGNEGNNSDYLLIFVVELNHAPTFCCKSLFPEWVHWKYPKTWRSAAGTRTRPGNSSEILFHWFIQFIIWYGIEYQDQLFLRRFRNDICLYCLKESSTTPKNETDWKYDSVSTLTDRSILSDEMASLCAKLPIYRIKRTTTQRKSFT